MSWSNWVIAAIVLFVVELLTPGGFFFACLGVGALFAGIAVYFNLYNSVQWIVFIVVSLASIFTLRPIARKFLQVQQKRTNVDALIGQKAYVTEAINPHQPGTVKIEGELWRAQAEETIEAGSWVEVVSISGTRLSVKKVQS